MFKINAKDVYELALAAASFGKIHECFLTCNEKKVLRMHVALNRKNDLSLKRVTQDFRHIIDVEPAIKAATEVDRKPPLKIFLFFFFFFSRISQTVLSEALQ